MVVFYDIVRNDGDFFRLVVILKGLKFVINWKWYFILFFFVFCFRLFYWNYCVFDEGYIIKNGKIKV